MAKLAYIILPILGRFAWNTLVPLLYTLFVARYGKGLLGFIFELIEEMHPKIEADEITKEEAEKHNLDAIKAVTSQSPGLFTSMAKLIHTVAYMEKVRKDDPKKFNEWIRILMRVEGSDKMNYSSTDYMYLYKQNFMENRNK